MCGQSPALRELRKAMINSQLRIPGFLLALGVLAALPMYASCQHNDKEHKEEKHKEHQASKEPMKFKAMIHHKEVIIDPAKDEDLEKVHHALMEGHLERLEPYKEFDVLAVLRYDLGLWTIVVFLALFFILSKVAWGPMLEGLQKREQTIRSAVEEAKEARKETERVRAEFKAEMEKAYAEIPRMMDEARRDAQALAEEMRAKAQADIQTERQRLRREIDMARDQALQELWNRTADLATLVSSKAIRRSLSEDDHRRLVDDALTELNQRERRSA